MPDSQSVMNALPAGFYRRDAMEVARDLLGQRLVRGLDGRRAAGLVVETEAYRGESDLACHARAGRTKRTEVMYGPPGRAYVYLIYGMYWCLNAVTCPEGEPAAVLIRAIWPIEGLDWIAGNRPGAPPHRWADGPGKLCRALQIDGRLNASPLTDPASGLWIEPGPSVSEDIVRRGPRVGIQSVPEPWRSQPWRFWIEPPDLTISPVYGINET